MVLEQRHPSGSPGEWFWAKTVNCECSQRRALPRSLTLLSLLSCRSCTSFASWAGAAKKQNANAAVSSVSSSSLSQAVLPPADCPPDVDVLGNHTGTFLPSLAATYPPQASAAEQSDMAAFMTLFSRLYPCWVCADDLRAWMQKPENEIRRRLKTRGEFGHWMCEAHNEVNRKLGKKEFDCRFWEDRWRTGWKDGRCD